MAAPELRLNVTLDLAAFRTQLGKLAQTSASHFYPVKLTIDQRNFKLQLAQLSKIKPVININDSQLEGARARIGTLNKSLATLRRATATPIEIKLKYTEVGKPPSAAAGQIGRAVSGGVRGSQALEGVGRSELLNIRKMMSEAGMAIGKITSLSKATASELRNSIVPAFTNSGEEAVNGLAAGLKDSSSKIGKIAGKVGVEAVNGIKDALGIASPSRVFRQIGEFSVDGLEIGFLNGLKDFKSKSIAEIKKIVALMQFELAKVSSVSMTPGMSRSAGGRASRAYMSPIGPLPEGSQEPWAFSQYRYQPFMAQPGQTRGAGIPAMRERFPFAAAPSIMGTTTSPSMFGASFPALPSAGMTGGNAMRQAQLQSRMATAYARSAAREASVLGESQMYARVSGQVPLGGTAPRLPAGNRGGALALRPTPSGGGGGFFGGGQFNVPNLPGAGLVREIGTEFGFAAKQVLLFGTAYKALAFIQGFPAQVGAAVGALQSFRNTLGAISPSAEEAAESSQFILDVVDKYNTPIQSARDGFTKLYASMKPTGFSGDEIRDLFLGISQAAATFGMSAEKVDRVNYAFAQMASKGQVMSEELKGQLGDVLPGAMGIFAEAAGFEGPDAITKFSKALEDGAYKGAAMKTLLVNVTSIMQKEFGPGAEGAARTFQGVMNRMQNSAKLLYEAFEPVAVGFLNSVVMPMTSGIKTLTDGFNAFFTGTLAKTEGGAAFAQQLNNLKPSFEGIRANLAALIPSFQTFGQLLLSVAQFLTQLAGNPIVGFLLKVYTNVLLVNAAFNLLGGRILIGLVAGINAAIARLVLFGTVLNSLSTSSGLASTRLAGTQLQMQLLQRSAAGAIAPVTTLLGSLLRMAGIGAIAIAVTIVVNGLTELKDAQARIDRLRGARDPVGPAGPVPIMTAARRYTGATREKVTSDQQKQVEYLAQLRNELTKLQATQTKAGGALSQTALGNLGNVLGGLSRENINAKITETKLLIKNAEEVVNLKPGQFRTAAEQQRVTTAATVSGGGASASGAKEKQGRESQEPLLKLELQYQKELLPLESEINRARLLDNNLAVIRLENEKNMLDLKYEASRVSLEDIPPAEKRLKIEALQAKGQIAALKARYEIELEIAKVLEDHDKLLEGMEDRSNLELLNRQSYIELLLSGVKPAHAKITIEVENEIAALTKSLELRRLNLEEEIKLLKAKKAGGGVIDEGALANLESGLKRTRQRLAELPAFGTGETARQLAIADAPKLSEEYTAEGLESAEDRLKELMNTGYQVVQAANAIGDAFGEAFKGVITGSMTAQEALAGMFRSIADHFADMVAQMIAEYLKMQAIGLLKTIFGAVAGGIGGGGANLGPNSSAVFGLNTPDMMQYSPLTAANGAVWGGGFTAFANGGMVTGPTLGLVGEGRYNEAIIPLPDGKSVPVQLSGGAGGNAAPINTSIVVNVKNGQAESQMSGNQGNQLARELEGAVRQVILKETRPGGLIPGSR